MVASVLVAACSDNGSCSGCDDSRGVGASVEVMVMIRLMIMSEHALKCTSYSFVRRS